MSRPPMATPQLLCPQPFQNQVGSHGDRAIREHRACSGPRQGRRAEIIDQLKALATFMLCAAIAGYLPPLTKDSD